MLKDKIPVIGGEDFKDIINRNYYYVDKTLFIKDIEESGAEVCLFTRPRRFGKTLALSTLKYFYDIENKQENRKYKTNWKIIKSSTRSNRRKGLSK